MTIFKGKAKVFEQSLRILTLIGILVFSLNSCDSIFGSDEEASITVSNQYGETLDVYMDDSFQFSLDDGDEATIEDVSIGDHYLEAKDAEGTVVSSTTMSVETDMNYSWTID